MICTLLALSEIAHELNQMDIEEPFSLFCDVKASRCCDLKFDVWDEALSLEKASSCPDSIVEMGCAIRNLADRMEHHFMARVGKRAGKGLEL